jgi:predicted helicase
MSTARKQTTESFAQLAARAHQLKPVFARELEHAQNDVKIECDVNLGRTAAETLDPVAHDALAEEFSQAAAFWEYLQQSSSCFQRSEICDWIIRQLAPLRIGFIRDVLSKEQPGDFQPSPPVKSPLPKSSPPKSLRFSADRNGDWMFQSYEQFLFHYHRDARSSRGVFYTPPQLVRFILGQVDSTLSQCFHHHGGLGHQRETIDAPPLRLLDPAMGTGIFLTEAVELLHRKYCDGKVSCDDGANNDWSDFVSTWLRDQFRGIDVSLAPLIIALFRLAEVLERTNYSFERFRGQQVVQIHWQDALSDALWVEQLGPFSVVIGNPPYRSLSTNESSWVQALLHGDDGSNEPVANYFEVAGKPLGERKVWLHDDYVKFMRLAHWLVEKNNSGIVAYVTNHGYLDNPTFRGMRYQLLETFNRIEICDLHGSAKKKETTPDGGRDQNVFPVESGVAVGVFSRIPNDDSSVIVHRDIWGDREAKLTQLDELTQLNEQNQNAESKQETISPSAPYFFFVPSQGDTDPVYLAAVPIDQAMPAYYSAVVTARDSLVIDFDKDKLLHRLNRFRDGNISDADARTEFFPSARSTRYPAGDTRSWKLPAAREKLSQIESLEEQVRLCHYRPFDQRYIYWADWMIDWPRTEGMNHLIGQDMAGRDIVGKRNLEPSNLGLIVRRQQLSSQECSFFWITDGITIDGVIRSDNRGNETVFPLRLMNDSIVPNFSSQFIDRISQATGMSWDDCGSADSTLNPRSLLNYIYAIFFSPSYRERFAEMLRVEFPRVPIVRSAAIFEQLAQLGGQLVDLHLLRNKSLKSSKDDLVLGDDLTVAAGFPKHISGSVWINKMTQIATTPLEIWEYLVGGHQVARKWLKDRRGRPLTSTDIEHYQQCLNALKRTTTISRQIDQAISQSGNWDSEFEGAAATRSSHS